MKSKEVKLFEILQLDGSPYRRLAGRDDLPLPAADERKEQEKLARNVAERRKESTAQRSLRVSDYERRPEWQREAWQELPEAFEFRVMGEAMWEGKSVYVIDATPRPSYAPRSRTAEILVHLRGRLWVNTQDFHLVKAEVEAMDTISIGLFLVRLAKGSRGSFEQTWVNGEVWLPRRVQVSVAMRLGLLKTVRVEQEVSYGKCRALQNGAMVVSYLNHAGGLMTDIHCE